MATYNFDDPLSDWQQVVNPTKVSSSGYGQMYDDLINSNPYRDLHYRQSPWQRFLGILGFRTSYDDFVEQAEINANEYDAGILSMKAQNEYNSPEQEAMRMRAAGLNPDLQGLSDVAESAQPTEDPNGMTPQDSQGEFGKAVSAIMNYAGGFSDIIAGAMSLFKNFQEIGAMRLENDKTISQIAEDDVFKRIPASGFATDEDFKNWIEHQTSFFEDNGEEFFKTRKDIPKHLRQRYIDVYLRSLTNLPTDIARYKNGLERAKLRKEYSMFTNSRFYDEGYGYDDALDAVLGPLIELSDDVTELSAKVAKLTAQNQQTEQNVISSELQNRGVEADILGQQLDVLNSNDYGALSANDELLSTSAHILQVECDKLITETQKKIISKLKTLSDSGHRFAKCLEYQMVLSKLYNWNPYEAFTKGVKGVSDFYLGVGSMLLGKGGLK